MHRRLLTIDEVALMLNVSSSTVRRWIRSGKLIGQKAGVQWRFDPDVVLEAFENGRLSGASPSRSGPQRFAENSERPQWARPVLTRWRDFLEQHLEQIQPEQVIVNDRRGAKVWSLIMPNRYSWGKNLWHSTAIDMMTGAELRRTFALKKVLIFDELMQHGVEMYKLRQQLENVGALVTSLVCVRRRSHVESGELSEYKAVPCEDADNKLFVERAALTSRLMCLPEPPLDVDHLVVSGSIDKGIEMEHVLKNLAKWGLAFVIRYPDNEYKYLTVTLDRPQFFETGNLAWLTGFSVSWEGPCKIRVYINPQDRKCYCSFIVYPEIEAPADVWAQASVISKETKQPHTTTREDFFSETDDVVFRRVYENICMKLAVKLLDDFIASGATNDIGIRLENSRDALDVDQLRATFGPSQGNEIAKGVREVLSHATSSEDLFPRAASTPLPLLIRKGLEADTRSHDAFRCRIGLLKAVPERYSRADSGSQQVLSISYSKLLCQLPQFSESTIGQVLDYELDWGTIKPLVRIDFLSRQTTKVVKVWRGFIRGEFGSWFEWDRSVLTNDNIIIQKTLAVGPTVVEQFLKRTGESQMSATHFDKVFANLMHDWPETYGLLYLGWRPYKYGPIPIVPTLSPSGEYMKFERFLVDMGCVTETKEKHGSQVWRRYEPADESKVPWRTLYERRTDGKTRAYVVGLIRLYAAIQEKCTTLRPSDPRSSGLSVFRDPLVSLAAVRNQKTAYICGWFEVHDWKQTAKFLFPLLQASALGKRVPSEPFLKPHLEEFAAPSRLLFDKIEMYRNLVHLREQIVKLRDEDDFEMADVLLDTIDSGSKFESHSGYPVQNLEWACKIMRAFSSLVRQVLTACKFDADDRPPRDKVDQNGRPKDASFYLKELLLSCPELRILEHDLRDCVGKASRHQLLTEGIANSLSKTFSLISDLFDKRGRIPDPRPPYERDREHLRWWDGLLTRFREIQIPDPYVIAVVDIYNLRNLPKISDFFGSTYDRALDGLLNWVARKAHNITRHCPDVIVGGLSGDTVIFGGRSADKVLLCTVELMKETTRRLDVVDHRLAQLGLLRAGLAWHETTMGEEFRGVQPGLTAYKIGDKPGQTPGTVSITEAVYKQLSGRYQSDFVKKGEDSGQGRLFVRLWNQVKAQGE